MNSQTQQGAITQKISSVFTKSPRASTVSESPRQFDSKTVGTTVKDYSPGFTRLSRGPTALEVPRPLFSKTLGVLFLSAMLGLSLVLPEAHATGFQLRVTDLTAGTPAVIVTDNDVGVDLSGTVGKIISDLETTNFSVTTIGTSKPYIGSLPNINRLDITNLIVTSTTAGDLLIEITDTGFSSASMATWGADFFTSIGGTLGIHSNTIQIESYWDADNEGFGVGTALSNLAFSGSYGFGGTDLFT
ncbi:MAG: hypothetical protein VST68_10520, partial [Nitrospirota bacterium]|nr:hypothetical protein [Nitrospirota bacterium]